jgi:para-nitrobenzyl esterase
LQSERGKGKAFVYYFDQRTPESTDGANHAADLAYVFGNFNQSRKKPRVEEEKLSDQMQANWINFARTGDPNGKGLPEWPNFTVANQKVMRLDAAPSPQPVPNLKQIEALDAYFAWRREEAKEKR